MSLHSRNFPDRKLVAGALAGIVFTALVWGFNSVAAGPGLSGEYAAAITVVVTFVVSYFVPSRANNHPFPLAAS